MIAEQLNNAVDALLERLLNLPTDKQQEILNSLRTEQPEVCARAESILATRSDEPSQPPMGDTTEQAFWPNAVSDPLAKPTEPLAAASSPAADPDEAAGMMIGPYKLLQLMGKGGMGAVWMAEQTEPVHRRVALKIIKGELGGKEVLARFEAERQALAMMDHPNIAKILDAGVVRGKDEGGFIAHPSSLSSGRPYFVMELVKGIPFTKYCDQEHLTPAQRLELFIPVCNAVQHAHQKGVIHRDLKPSNVLVALYDGKPVPKVIDFGIAKATHQKLTQRTLFTEVGQIIGTLEYMAPEQAELNNLDVDTRADIYSLGVMLYELLTGTLPFSSKELRNKGFMEMLRLIRDVEPTKPSSKLSKSENLPAIAAKRMQEPKRLSRLMKGDLDWIVMKCLEKERARRYETANQLGEELRRFLADEPVQAGPPSVGYRTRKFLRRNKGAVIAASVLLLQLVAGIVAASIGLVMTDQAREAERYQRHQAQVNEGKANRAALEAASATRAAESATKDARAAAAKEKRANEDLQEQLYKNYISVAERELTLNQDVGLALDLLQKCPERLRGWEWDYLKRLRDGPRRPLTGHKKGLWTAAFNKDGSKIATASIDGTVKIWDAKTGNELRNYTGHSIIAIPVPVTCLAYSPDGKHIASASLFPSDFLDPLNARKAQGVIKIWDAENEKERSTIQYKKQIGLVYCLAYSPDGNRIASSHINDEKIVAIWDTRTGKEVHVIRDNASHVHGLRYSPDGRLLVAGCTDGTIKIWNAVTFDLVRIIINAHEGPVYNMSFSPPDGARFASAGTDGTVIVWETATGEPVMRLRGHTGAAMGVAYSPDGQRIASSGYDNTVRLWDAATGKEKITLRGHKDLVWSVAFSPDGRQLVSASFDNEARIWDSAPAPVPSGEGLFTLVGHSDRVNTVAVSQDGRFLASAGWDSDIRLWNAHDGRPLQTLKGHKSAVWSVAFSPDNKQLASASWDRTVKLWDVESGRNLMTFARHGAPVHCVKFSPDGKSLVSTSWDGLVKVWDPQTGKEAFTYAGHLLPTLCAAFSSDGQRIASGSGDRNVGVWMASDGRDVLSLKGHAGLVHCVAFSPNGKLIASASWDHTVIIWDAKNGEKLLTFRGHNDRVQSVAFSRDSTRIASVSEDKTMRLWDPATGRELQPACYHYGVIYSVAFTADSRRAVTGSWASSGWVKTWNIR